MDISSIDTISSRNSFLFIVFVFAYTFFQKVICSIVLGII